MVFCGWALPQNCPGFFLNELISAGLLVFNIECFMRVRICCLMCSDVVLKFCVNVGLVLGQHPVCACMAAPSKNGSFLLRKSNQMNIQNKSCFFYFLSCFCRKGLKQFDHRIITEDVWPNVDLGPNVLFQFLVVWWSKCVFQGKDVFCLIRVPFLLRVHKRCASQKHKTARFFEGAGYMAVLCVVYIYICCKVKNWSKIWGFIS